MATPQTPRARRSPLARYAPLIAVVVVVAIVAVVVGVVSGKKKSNNSSVTTNTNSAGQQTFSDVPIFYNEAKQNGTLAKYTWQPHCDTTTGNGGDPDPVAAPVRAGRVGVVRAERWRNVAGRDGDDDQGRILQREAGPDVRCAPESGRRVRHTREHRQGVRGLRAESTRTCTSCTDAKCSS